MVVGGDVVCRQLFEMFASQPLFVRVWVGLAFDPGVSSGRDHLRPT